MAEEQDVNALKRRGRRRLVGAVALVLLAVIVLPMVFDPEPRNAQPPVSVRIPSEDDPAFKPKPVPKAAPKAPAPESKAPAAPTPVPTPSAPPPVAEKPAPPAEKPPVVADKPAPPPEKKVAEEERKRAEAALANAEFYVQVAALADADKLKELTNRLVAAQLPYYTESVATAKGKVTRVRVGPFETRDAAQKAADKLKGLGLTPGRVTAKS